MTTGCVSSAEAAEGGWTFCSQQFGGMRFELFFDEASVGDFESEFVPVPDRCTAQTAEDVIRDIIVTCPDYFPPGTTVDDVVLRELRVDDSVGSKVNPLRSPQVFQRYDDDDNRFIIFRKQPHEPTATSPRPNHQDQTVVCRGCQEPKTKDQFAGRQLRKGTRLCFDCAEDKEMALMEKAVEKAVEKAAVEEDDKEGWPTEGSSERDWLCFEEYCMLEQASIRQYGVHDCWDADELKEWRACFLRREYQSIWTGWDQQALDGEFGREAKFLAERRYDYFLNMGGDSGPPSDEDPHFE